MGCSPLGGILAASSKASHTDRVAAGATGGTGTAESVAAATEPTPELPPEPPGRQGPPRPLGAARPRGRRPRPPKAARGGLKPPKAARAAKARSHVKATVKPSFLKDLLRKIIKTFKNIGFTVAFT